MVLVYMLTLGILMVNVTIYSSTMDPMGIGSHHSGLLFAALEWARFSTASWEKKNILTQ